jgi:hypothetical protein
MTDGYKVEPGTLDVAGAAFRTEGRETETHASEWVGQAHLPDSAFGNLPVSYKLANQYQDFYAQVQDHLKTLHASMHSCAHRLTVTAENYRLTEDANTLRGGV